MLTKRTTQIPVGGGVEEGVSDVLFDAPLLREAVNTQIAKAGSIGKRYGEDTLPSGLPSTSTYGEHSTIAEHEKRAIVLTQLGAYMHDPAKATWVSAGGVQPRPSQVKCDRFVRQNNSSTEPEIALVTVNAKTIACVVWSDAEVLESFYMFAEVPADGSPLKVLSGPTKFGASQRLVHNLRLATIGTTVYVIGADLTSPSNIWCSKVDVAASYTFAAATTVNPGWCAGGQPVALLSDNSAALWAVLDENPGASNYSIRKLNTSFVETVAAVTGARRAVDAIRYGTTIVVCCGDGSIDDCADSLVAPPTNHVIITPAAGGLLETTTQRGTICEAGSGTFFAAWERQASATAILNYGIAIASISAAYGAVATGVAGTVKLGGRAAYRTEEGVPLLPVIDVGPSSFVADAAQDALWRCGYIAKPATDASGAYTLAHSAQWGHDVAALQGITRFLDHSVAPPTKVIAVLPSLVFDPVTGQALLPYKVVADGTYVWGSQDVNYGIDLLRLRTVDAPAERNASSQSIRCFASGHGASYTDGIVHAELTPPPITDLADIAADLDADVRYGTGTVDYATASPFLALAARWRDERGNLHRGVPLPVNEAINPKPGTGVGDTLAQRVTFPRLFPNTIRGDKGGQKYEIEVYAAATFAGPYYFFDVVTPRAHPTYDAHDYIILNVVGTTSITTWPLGSDHIATIPVALFTPPYDGILMWTAAATPSELAHVPPPAAIDVCSTQERLWLLSAEAGRLDLFPSKRLVEGFAPEFPTALRIRIPDEGGEATAIAANGDRIVVFKERQIYAVFGDPGDNTGGSATIQTPRLIPSDVGCREAQGVVEGPFGVVFRAASGGFHLLAAGSEQVTRLPQLEDTLGDYVVTSGVLVADRKEVRWSITTASKAGKTLVWDYENNAWMTHAFTASTAHACTIDGNYTRLVYAGTVRQERVAWATSDTHEMLLTSAWVKLAGLQGFKRVWKTIFKFRRDLVHGSAGVTIRIGYNYDSDTWLDIRTWTATELGTLQLALGTDTFDLVVHHTRQKIEAFRFQIEEVDPGGQTPVGGSGLTLLGVACEWGRRQGSGAQTTGATQRK